MFAIFDGKKWKTSNSRGGSYDGSKQMGDLDSMPIFSSNPNKIVNQTYNILSERSTTLFHTYGAVKSAVKRVERIRKIKVILG